MRSSVAILQLVLGCGLRAHGCGYATGVRRAECAALRGASMSASFMVLHIQQGKGGMPGQLAPLALQNKSEIYSLLFRASAETLLTVARDQTHLGAEIGFFSVLHHVDFGILSHVVTSCLAVLTPRRAVRRRLLRTLPIRGRPYSRFRRGVCAPPDRSRVLHADGRCGAS